MDKNNKKSGFLVKNREFLKNGVFVGLVDGEGKGGNGKSRRFSTGFKLWP